MRQQDLELTRRSLHGIAELVLAGPQYAASQSIRLRVTPWRVRHCDLARPRVDGLELVTPAGRLPLARHLRRPRARGGGRGAGSAGRVRRRPRRRPKPTRSGSTRLRPA